MGPLAEEATKKYEAEVDEEAARLIEQGVPPWEASSEASKNIRARRSGKKRVIPMTVD